MKSGNVHVFVGNSEGNIPDASSCNIYDFYKTPSGTTVTNSFLRYEGGN